MLGIYELHIRRIAFDTGISKDRVLEIFKSFEDAGKAKYIEGYVVLSKFLKHQNLNGNMENSAIRSWNELPLSVRDNEFCKPIERLCKGFKKASEPMIKGCQRDGEPIAEIEIEREREYKSNEGDIDKPFKTEMQNDPIDVPKDLQEVLDYCKQINIPIGRGKVFHAYYDDAGWCFTRGGQFIPVANWRQKLVNDINRGWHEAEPEQSQPQFLNE
jgi:hypothetical protein